MRNADHHVALRSTRLALAVTLTWALALSVAGGVAQAATSFGAIGQFGTLGDAAGDFGESSPRGVAVDEGGDLWVTDGGNARVQKFSPSDEFLLALGWGVENGAAEFQDCVPPSACQAGISGSGGGQFSQLLDGIFPGHPDTGVAVAPRTGNVYVADSANNRIEEFSSQGSYLSQFTGENTPAGSFKFPTGLAIQPTTGDVYVMDSENNAVDRFSPTGSYECQITGQADSSQCAGGASEVPQQGFSIGSAHTTNLAVDSGGDLYVADIGNEVIDEFSPGGAYLGQLSTDSPWAVAVDSSGRLFVVEEGSKVAELDPSGSKIAEFGSPEIGLATAIAISGTGSTERVYVDDADNDKVWTFGPVVTPTCSTSTRTSALTATSATISGAIDPENIRATYYFEYGISDSYGARTAEVSSWEGDEGAEPKEVSESLTGLQPDKTYDYQLIASNTHGSSPCGNQSLVTRSAKPLTEDERVPTGERLAQTEATLQAEVNANNESTHWTFEYGTNPSLAGATQSPIQQGEIPAEFGSVEVSQQLHDLIENTIYYYRVVASNAGGGTSEGPIESFLTRPANPITGGAHEVAQTSAVVGGTFDPGGVDTRYYYEYGDAACAPSACGLHTAETDAGSDAGPLAPNVGLRSLEPLTTYHYRLVVTNAASNGGGPSYGPEREFTTLPLGPGVTTDPPTTVGATSATVAGRVVPDGAPTTYRFEYGTNTAYAASAPVPAGDVASSIEAQDVAISLADLQPDSIYHYRLVATNPGGTTLGLDQAFVTNLAGEPGVGSVLPGFSLTGSDSSTTAATVFANLTSLIPLPPSSPSRVGTPKQITKGQELSKALKACRREKLSVKRVRCEDAALEKDKGRKRRARAKKE